MRTLLGIAALIGGAILFAPSATAEVDAGPALGVARMSVANGDISVMRSDSGDWIAATVNMPVVEGDMVRATGGSHAELQLDDGNFVRITTDTEVHLADLASNRFRVGVLQGTALYSELPRSEADVDIETPYAVVRPMKDGRYRVSVAPGKTVIGVARGRAEVAFQSASHVLESGRKMIVTRGPAGLVFETKRYGPKDELDQWATNRDEELRRARSYKHVSGTISGAAELDHYGEWRTVAGTGFTWFPYVTASWSPYRHGRWLWVSHFGWTWVGSEPWGWAPYHWGRWYRHSVYGWGWMPGSPATRHVWRPALVAFFGLGRSHGSPPAPGSFSGVAWCPLAPGERYVPWYGRHHPGQRPERIIADRSVRIYNSYSNARQSAGGISYVASNTLERGAHHTPRALRTAGAGTPVAIRGPLPIVPNRASQGRLVQVPAGARSRAKLTTLRRGAASALRDGTSRAPFDAQRDRIQASVSEFRNSYRPGAANLDSNSTVRARTGPAAGSPAGTTRPAAGATAARGVSRQARVAAFAGATAGAPRTPGARVASTTSPYAARTSSRVGATGARTATGAAPARRPQAGTRTSLGSSTGVRSSGAMVGTRGSAARYRTGARAGYGSTRTRSVTRSSRTAAGARGGVARTSAAVYGPRRSAPASTPSRSGSYGGYAGGRTSYPSSSYGRSSAYGGSSYGSSSSARSASSARSSARSTGSSSSARAYGSRSNGGSSARSAASSRGGSSASGRSSYGSRSAAGSRGSYGGSPSPASPGGSYGGSSAGSGAGGTYGGSSSSSAGPYGPGR